VETDGDALSRDETIGLDDEELEMGIRAVSAPIRDIDGNVIAAMSMPGPSNRLTPERIPEIAQALVEAASAVSAHILREKLAGTPISLADLG
jgi:DNA-binding IclR family transcriptional regulator